MAINNLTIILIFIATSASAKQFIVGDDNGWSLNFDYQSWAESTKFVIGDQIVFKYPIGKHNVFEVDETGFQRCVVPLGAKSLATGYDVVNLTTPGRKWYISGIRKQCETGGMKLVIDVSPQPTQAPTTAPVLVPSYAPVGKTYMVGDDRGWTLNYDYKAWAKGKKFVIGDVLVFKYTIRQHNVFLVEGPAFQQCTIPDPRQALTSGRDSIILTTPGKRWYICGIANHCKQNMKLEIEVSPR
ncbi:uclacyanin 1-like [Cynara cardunculus var. scolymus]|uniref:uclacyanin 1-like n=1 Tax=Cynara cardunculus var. scolymus TaxID=59895 RepID=UPI000D62DFD2|nr:uclacyanin 1-like [Cynara cardunculus var. scolymus]